MRAGGRRGGTGSGRDAADGRRRLRRRHGPLLRRDCYGGRLGFKNRWRLRRRRRFGDGSVLEEIFTQGSFEIGYKLSDDFSLGHAERCRPGVANRFKFRLVLMGMRYCL
jgi:hypothetical protein